MSLIGFLYQAQALALEFNAWPSDYQKENSSRKDIGGKVAWIAFTF
jgi:hypothetical protein